MMKYRMPVKLIVCPHCQNKFGTHSFTKHILLSPLKYNNKNNDNGDYFDSAMHFV